MSQRRTSVIKRPQGAVLLLHLFLLANFFRGVMLAVTPKATTRPGAPWGPGDKDQEKGAVSLITKGTQGPGEGGVQGREPRGRARGPGKDGGLEVWMMDRKRQEGRMDGGTDPRTNAEEAGVQQHRSQQAKTEKEQKVWGRRRRNKGGWEEGTEVGCVGNTWRGLWRMGKARGRFRRGGSWKTASKEEDKSKYMWGQVLRTGRGRGG